MKPLIERPICEICMSTKYQNIVSIDFMDSKISNFIEEYYCNRIPKEYLSGNKFEVAKCNNCGFIWQIFIMNDELNYRL